MSFRMAPTITTSNPLRSPLSTPTSRRVVLGNKTTNLTPTHHTHTPNPKHQRQELLNAPSDFFDIDGIKVRTTGQFASDEMARTKRPPRTPPTSYFFPPRPTHPPTPTNLAAGQKRGIDEIEKGDEHHDSENMTKEGNKGTGKQASATGGNGNLVSKFQSFERVMEEEGTGANKQDATFAAAENERATQRQGVTTMPSFHASQEGPLPLEEQFSIQEEMSQNTVDKLNATSFPQSYSSQATRPSEAIEPSQDSSAGMSSFVDFDQHSARASSTPASDKDKVIDRQAFVQEKAELLRARLQLAAYKVRTNQIDKGIEDLAHPQSSRSRSPSLPPPVAPVEAAERAAGPGGILSSASKAANGLLDLGRRGR